MTSIQCAFLESHIRNKYGYEKLKWVGNHLIGCRKHSKYWEPITNKTHAEILLKEAISQIVSR